MSTCFCIIFARRQNIRRDPNRVPPHHYGYLYRLTAQASAETHSRQVHRRQDEEGEQRGGDEAANHHNGERLFDLGAHATAEQDGQDAQHGAGSGHELGPQALDAGQADGLVMGMALGQEVAGLRQQHEPVLHGDAKQGDEADRRGDVQGLAADEERGDAADEGAA